MPHLDEGTLHALLDGELELAEVSEIQMHLGTCAACGSRLQEVKQVLAEADRLVGAVEPPTSAPRQRTEPPRTPPTRPYREPESWDQTPVLLVPESTDAAARRARWLKGLRWAAVLAVVVGGGRILSDSLGPRHPMLPERDLTSATPAVPPAVVSPEESRRSPSRVTSDRKPARTAPQNQVLASKATGKPETVVRQPAADSVDEITTTPAPASEDSVAADEQLLAAEGASADSASEQSVAGLMADSAPPTEAKRGPVEESRQDDELATRRAAAEALAELDRERIRERANAATAALPPARQEVPAAAESAPPAPRTLQQRAGVYLRIGLDEAAKQLGVPVHVIEGMTPQFIGLTQGRSVAGADPARPVVRVVYLDSRERMILLDQQRMRNGQAPGAAAGNLRWAVGDVMLYLRGEPSPEVLQSLRRRVR